jgi:hypothetical protein
MYHDAKTTIISVSIASKTVMSKRVCYARGCKGYGYYNRTLYNFPSYSPHYGSIILSILLKGDMHNGKLDIDGR